MTATSTRTDHAAIVGDVYAAFGRRKIARFVRPSVLESVEIGGAVLIILTELLGLLLKGSFSANWLPLTAPGTSNATAPGQTTFSHGAFAYPDTYDTEFDGQNRWVDVEVTPSSEPPPPSSPAAEPGSSSAAFLTFFP